MLSYSNNRFPESREFANNMHHNLMHSEDGYTLDKCIKCKHQTQTVVFRTFLREEKTFKIDNICRECLEKMEFVVDASTVASLGNNILQKIIGNPLFTQHIRKNTSITTLFSTHQGVKFAIIGCGWSKDEAKKAICVGIVKTLLQFKCLEQEEFVEAKLDEDWDRHCVLKFSWLDFYNVFNNRVYSFKIDSALDYVVEVG